MDERLAIDERFEHDLRAGLAALLDPLAGSHPRWETSPAAERARGIPARRRSARLDLLLVAAVAALVLIATLAAALFAGAWRPNPAIVITPWVEPSPAPSPSLSAPTADVEATLLATTKAHPLPAQATCPPGSDPDAPGPADQERAPASDSHGPMAFVRRAGRIVLAADDGTWTFDVCANVWQRMRPAQGPRSTPDEQPDWLVYDADSDRTVAFTSSGQFWSYDLAADSWAKAGWYPEIRRGWSWGSWSTGAVYHDPSGLIVIYDGATMWTYSVEAGTLTEIPQRPDPSLPPGAGIPPDTRAEVDARSHYDGSGGDFIGYDPRTDLLIALVRPARPGGPNNPRPADQTWTFEPGSGTWRSEASYWNQPVGFLGMAGGPAMYDEVSDLTLFPDWLAFDGGRRSWRAERFEAGSSQLKVNWCATSPVYDPLNGRIVCLGGTRYGGEGPEDLSGVSAFSSASGEWRWLLEPLASASPTP